MELVNQVWMESIPIYCTQYTSDMIISIKDDDLMGSHIVGRYQIPLNSLFVGDIVQGKYDLYHDDGFKVKLLRRKGKASLPF